MKKIVSSFFLLGQLACQEPTGALLKKDQIPASHSDTGTLGQAYSKIRKRLLNLSCVQGTAEIRGNTFGELEYANNLSREQVNSIINGDLSVGVKFPSVNAGASAHIALGHTSDHLSETHTFYWSGVNRKQTLVKESLGLSDRARGIMNQHPDRLEELCGEEFISEIQYGAVLLATIRFDFLSEEDKKKYGGALKFGLIGGTTSVEGSLEKIDQAVIQRSSVSIVAEQIGGDATGLLSILASDVSTCSLADLEPCLKTLENLVSYSQDDFRSSLANSENQDHWNVITYTTQSYKDSGIMALVPEQPSSRLPLAIHQLRQELERGYHREITNKARALRLQSLGDGYLGDEQKTALQDLIDLADRNLEVYRLVQGLCYDDPYLCEDEWAASQSAIQDYDESILQIHFDDAEEGPFHVEVFPAQGGGGGRPFSSLEDFDAATSEAPRLVRFGFHSDYRVNTLFTEYADGSSIKLGKNRGSYQEMTLGEQEYIERLEVHVGRRRSHRIFYLRIDTNLRKPALEGGVKTRRVYTWQAPEGAYIAGFHGRTGDEVDRLGPIMVIR